jgi:hypothetical protein
LKAHVLTVLTVDLWDNSKSKLDVFVGAPTTTSETPYSEIVSELIDGMKTQSI